jgi:uncharacterized Rmd1/YagE family protein
MPDTVPHLFRAVAFVENFALKEMAASYPGAAASAHAIVFDAGGGTVFLFPFGAAVFRNVAADRETQELSRLRSLVPHLTPEVVREEFTVLETGAGQSFADGLLRIDRLTPDRGRIVALTVGQSAAMEYYERIVDRLFLRNMELVGHLERRGRMPMRVRPLHRFIGESLVAGGEVLAVVHLLDKPEEIWEDPVMDRLYAELRAQFDLGDRYDAMEAKLRSVQGAFETLLDVARERRMFFLEATVVVLILVEILSKFF